jgi:hypothetical protein
LTRTIAHDGRGGRQRDDLDAAGTEPVERAGGQGRGAQGGLAESGEDAGEAADGVGELRVGSRLGEHRLGEHRLVEHRLVEHRRGLERLGHGRPREPGRAGPGADDLHRPRVRHRLGELRRSGRNLVVDVLDGTRGGARQLVRLPARRAHQAARRVRDRLRELAREPRHLGADPAAEDGVARAAEVRALHRLGRGVLVRAPAVVVAQGLPRVRRLLVELVHCAPQASCAEPPVT